MRLPALLAFLLSAEAVFASEPPDRRDLGMLPRLPQAEIVDFRQTEQERTYPMGTVLEISGRLRYEREVTAEGALRQVTYRLPTGHGAFERFEQVRTALLSEDAELLFWCRGRDCGSSSLWANAVFGNPRLYGPDSQQTYALLRLPPPRQDSLLALYGVTRGNRRAYLHAEQFDASHALGELLPSASTLLALLRSNGQLLLPRLIGAPDPVWARLLGRSLKLDSTLRVALSGSQAEAWRAALVAEGVRAARLELDTGSFEGLRLMLLR